MRPFYDSSLDRTQRRVRGMVKVPCEIYTETSLSVSIIVDNRTLLIPKSEVDEIVREKPHWFGHDGYLIMSRKLAESIGGIDYVE